ncbi:MAG: NAD(P)/FAD-dependent oxidoreductase, partial [Saprospiraceae bacterium]
MNNQQIVIIGGGFAGLNLARTLNGSSYQVLLIDQLNHHQFQPLLYQVATAGLEPSNISFPLRNIFHGSKNVRIRLAEVQKIVPGENKVVTTAGEFAYDYLVLATGANTNFFGNKNLESFALPMKSTSEAIDIRQHILKNFEAALTAGDEEKKALLTYVVVGGGPTGVELAGALSEMKLHVLPKDFPETDFSSMRILLLEGSPALLSAMSAASSQKSRAYLEQMGVDVRTGNLVKDYDGQVVLLQDGTEIKTKTVVWAAGVKGNRIEGLPAESAASGNRVLVGRTNLVAGTANIFAIGDLAFMPTPKYPDAHPQVANVAVNQAKLLAKNFKRMQKNLPILEYEYLDMGAMATVGKHKAVV